MIGFDFDLLHVRGFDFDLPPVRGEESDGREEQHDVLVLPPHLVQQTWCSRFHLVVCSTRCLHTWWNKPGGTLHRACQTWWKEETNLQRIQ